MTYPIEQHTTCPNSHWPIDRYAAGELDDATRTAVEAHIETCAECEREANEALAIDAILSDAFARAAMMPAGGEPPALHAMAHTAIAEGRRVGHRRRVIRIGATTASAAALLLIAITVWPLLKTPPPEPGTLAVLAQIDPAVEAGLAWLAASQEPDGRWDARRHGATADFDIGLSGLAVLALSRRAETDASPALREARDRGIAYLLNCQKPDGQVVTAQGVGAMYGHAIATLALVEALHRNAPAALAARERVQRAVSYCARSQLPAGGWTYAAESGQPRLPDTSHTGWFVLALKRARDTGLDVPAATLGRAKYWVASVTADDGRVGYRTSADGTPATTAIGLMIAETAPSGPPLKDSANQMRRMLADGPAWTFEQKSLYFWHFAGRTRGLRDVDSQWTEALARSLFERQSGYGDETRGSWPNLDHDSMAAGRVYSTAMALMALDSLEGAR